MILFSSRGYTNNNKIKQNVRFRQFVMVVLLNRSTCLHRSYRFVYNQTLHLRQFFFTPQSINILIRNKRLRIAVPTQHGLLQLASSIYNQGGCQATERHINGGSGRYVKGQVVHTQLISDDACTNKTQTCNFTNYSLYYHRKKKENRFQLTVTLLNALFFSIFHF